MHYPPDFDFIEYSNSCQRKALISYDFKSPFQIFRTCKSNIQPKLSFLVWYPIWVFWRGFNCSLQMSIFWTKLHRIYCRFWARSKSSGREPSTCAGCLWLLCFGQAAFVTHLWMSIWSRQFRFANLAWHSSQKYLANSSELCHWVTKRSLCFLLPYCSDFRNERQWKPR